MTRLHVGHSSLPDLAAAARQAATESLAPAVHPAFALVLSSAPHDPEELAAALGHELGGLPWIGFTTPAVFAGTRLLEGAVAVGVIDSAEAYVGVGAAGPLSRNPRASGAAAAARALDQLPAPSPGRSRTLLMALDPFQGDASDALVGAVHEAGSQPLWIGGGVGGLARCAPMVRGRAPSDNVVIAALDLPGASGVAAQHGYQSWGPPTLVTRAQGPVLLELEYESAFDVCRRIAEWRGQLLTPESFASFAISHPLGIPQAGGEHVIRDVLGVEANGGLRCFTEVPDGSLVRVMRGDGEMLIAAARRAAAQARSRASPTLSGAFVFDCVSRRLALGPDFGKELEAFQSELGSEVPVFGCLTQGEIGVLGAGLPQFQNKTAAVLALPDR